MAEMRTDMYGLLVGQCENQAEYEALVAEHQSLYRNWQEFIGPKIKKKGLKYTHIAEGCGVSRPIASAFDTHIPVRRSNVIMLAMMLGMNEAETNDLLARHARFHKLYPKNPEDAIWIYLIRHGCTEEPHKTFKKYKACYDRLLQEYQGSEHTGDIQMTTFYAGCAIPGGGMGVLQDPEKDLEFQSMIIRLLPSFQAGYARLMDYIDRCLSEMDYLTGNVRRIKPSEAFRSHPSFRRKYCDVIKDLRVKHELPSRMFLVALGIHLGMDTDHINEMLEMVYMGPLCPKDKLEGSVAFYLEELYCNQPSIFVPGMLKVDPIAAELRDSFDEDDEDDEDDDLFATPVESLPDYIKRRLEETNILGVDGSKSIQELLQLLK